MAVSREEIEKKVKELTANWKVYAMAERAQDWGDMNRLNSEHREICRWLAENGMPFCLLEYDHETLTFSVPSAIMTAVAQ